MCRIKIVKLLMDEKYYNSIFYKLYRIFRFLLKIKTCLTIASLPIWFGKEYRKQVIIYY